MAYAAVNGIDVYFELHGEGPPLLTISGSGNDLRRSPASILPVNCAFETLHYDQRGLGQTSKPEAEYTMADDADDAAALIHPMGWVNCHVLGTSSPPELGTTWSTSSPRSRSPRWCAPAATTASHHWRNPSCSLTAWRMRHWRSSRGGHIFMVQDRSAFPTMIEFLRGDA